MTELWIFTPGLEDKLQQCIAAASPDEKWQRMFKRNTNLEKSNPNISVQVPKTDEITTKVTAKEDISNYDDFIETVAAEPVLNLTIIIKESHKNRNVLNILATKMSSKSLDKLCRHVFSNIDIDTKFLTDFYTLLLPTYIKTSEVNIDFLICAKFHGPQMKKLVILFLTDKEMPSKMLQDYVNTFDEREKTEFMMNLCLLDIPDDKNFVKNLLTIFLAYRDCCKCHDIQIYILSLLKRMAHLCVTDKTYGKLFLTFLQVEKMNNFITNISDAKELIELHKTPFKRPCMNIINELVELSVEK